MLAVQAGITNASNASPFCGALKRHLAYPLILVSSTHDVSMFESTVPSSSTGIQEQNKGSSFAVNPVIGIIVKRTTVIAAQSSVKGLMSILLCVLLVVGMLHITSHHRPQEPE